MASSSALRIFSLEARSWHLLKPSEPWKWTKDINKVFEEAKRNTVTVPYHRDRRGGRLPQLT